MLITATLNSILMMTQILKFGLIITNFQHYLIFTHSITFKMSGSLGFTHMCNHRHKLILAKMIHCFVLQKKSLDLKQQ